MGAVDTTPAPGKPMSEPASRPQTTKALLNEIIFGYETLAGRLFDLFLIIFILLSVTVVLMDSVPGIHARWEQELYQIEWGFTLLFTIEYALRLYSSETPRRYMFSFYGLVDLLSILPTYLELFLTGGGYLAVVRILRVLRIFRILRLLSYIGEANLLVAALVHARRKIFLFLFVVLTLNVIFGSLMYIVEGAENGFTSIPVSMYWAIVTLTTVGYGDIAPVTGLGRFIAAMAMITGYAIIAVPTGIIGSELINEYQERQRDSDTKDIDCPHCQRHGHDHDARFCKQCGNPLT